MNLPNKLTMIRILIIPVEVIVYLLKPIFPQPLQWLCFIIIGILFVIASLTDYFDGAIARKRNIVTTFGKFIDPLADKLLVITTLLILTDAALSLGYWLPFWIPAIIIARELIVTSVRLVAVGAGKIIAAGKLGKSKTAVTMVAIILYLFLLPFSTSLFIRIPVYIIMGLAVFLTILSGWEYFSNNKSFIFESK